MYSLEELIKTFGEHSEINKKNQRKLLSDFKKNNPGSPVPEHMTCDFNFPKALQSICKEILSLRKRNDSQ